MDTMLLKSLIAGIMEEYNRLLDTYDIRYGFPRV